MPHEDDTSVSIGVRVVLQMRFVIKNAEATRKQEYKESFDTWLGQQKFTVTMSRHLQLLLYFIQVQQTPIPKEDYAQHFTDTMLNRLQNVSVQNIDAAAVTSLIKSLRVYHHNVKDLLDFRATCLNGFNHLSKEGFHFCLLRLCCIGGESWHSTMSRSGM